MNTHADKPQAVKVPTAAGSSPGLQSGDVSVAQFVDNRPVAIAQRKLLQAIDSSPHVRQLKSYGPHNKSQSELAAGADFEPAPMQRKEKAEGFSKVDSTLIQKKENNTGLPDNLKSGIEELSGHSLSDVRVHYNSAKPAQLQAHAYAQGTDIHVGSGQEKHLPHEAWHIVQQKQGRVKPTKKLKSKVNINDDAGLEKEADTMGGRALQLRSHQKNNEPGAAQNVAEQPSSPFAHTLRSVQFKTLIQLNADEGTVQRVIHLEEGNRDVDAAKAMNEISPLLRLRFNETDKEMVKEVYEIIKNYDAINKGFYDIADLATAVELELKESANLPEKGLLVDEELAETIEQPDFKKLVKETNIPAMQQQELASALLEQAQKMNAIYKKLAEVVTKREDAPENILKWFTGMTKEFAKSILKLASKTFGKPKAPLSVLIAGSGARNEMFPGSDLDLAAVTDVPKTPKQEEVVEIFSFMQNVEKMLNVTVSQISRMAGKGKEIGLSPDTGVFGFRNSPEELAKESLHKQNTGQDASSLISTKSAQDKKIDNRFFGEREKIANEDFGLDKLAGILQEFGPPAGVSGRMNIKVHFLRFPTLALRDLSQVYGLKSSSSFDRAREISANGYLDKGTTSRLLEALNIISGIRLQLHIHYGGETDTFASDESVRDSPEQYVLSPSEKNDLEKTVLILNDFHQKLVAFVAKRQKRNIFTSKSI